MPLCPEKRRAAGGRDNTQSAFVARDGPRLCTANHHCWVGAWLNIVEMFIVPAARKNYRSLTHEYSPASWIFIGWKKKISPDGLQSHFPTVCGQHRPHPHIQKGKSHRGRIATMTFFFFTTSCMIRPIHEYARCLFGLFYVSRFYLQASESDRCLLLVLCSTCLAL